MCSRGGSSLVATADRDCVEASQETSCTITPPVVAALVLLKTSPTGLSSHSSGTATLLPSLLLIQREKSGLALGLPSSCSAPGVKSAACCAAIISALVRLLVAGLLRSLLMVSICT
jgi:hypothetical protein